MTKQLQDSISACQAGDRAAFRLVYERYLNYVYSICLRYDIVEEDRKDIVQEIFAEVFVSLKKYDPKKGDFRFWLRSIAVRSIFAYWQKRKRNAFQTIDLDSIEREPQTEEFDTIGFDKEQLAGKIEQLPTGYRTVLNLFVIDGYSHKEIASLLNIKESTSRSQLARAIGQLKQILKKQKQYETI